MKAILVILVLFSAAAKAEDSLLGWLSTYGPAWIEGSKAKEPAKRTPSGLSSRAIMPSLWLPMCFFFDAAADAKVANEKITHLTAAYAACGIALKPYAFTLKGNYPRDHRKLTEAARRACPINSTFGVRGAIQIETSAAEVPQQMCSDPQAKGCSTLCTPLSVSVLTVDAGPEAGLHESMHSNCCGPVCVDEGEGSGRRVGGQTELASWKKVGKAVHAIRNIPRTLPTVIQPEGCGALKKGSSANDLTHWYDPEKRNYYVPEKSPDLQADLTTGQSVLPPTLVTAVQRPQISYTSEKIEPEPEVLVERAPAAAAAADETRARSTGVDTISRDRGASLRKSGDPTRKGGSEIGIVDAYGGATE